MAPWRCSRVGIPFLRQAEASPGTTALVLLTVAFAAAATGCTSTPPLSSHPVPPATLNSLLLSSPPPGFIADAGVSGEMSLESAAYSTPGSPVDLRNELQNNLFAGAYVHVWRRGDDYVTDTVFALDHPANTGRVESYLVSTVTDNPAAYLYPLPLPDSGHGFVLDARNKTGSKFIFCQGAIFSVDVYAFLVETCGIQPNGTELDATLAGLQYQRAIGAAFSNGSTGGPVVTPSSSP